MLTGKVGMMALPPNQRALLKTLSGEKTPIPGKRAILQTIAAGKVTFDPAVAAQVRPILEQIFSIPELKDIAQAAIDKQFPAVTAGAEILGSESMLDAVGDVAKLAAEGKIPLGEPFPSRSAIEAARQADEAAVVGAGKEELVPGYSLSIAGGEVGEIDGVADFKMPQFGGLTAKAGRSNNEDALLIAHDGAILMVVADGMGGHKRGETASQAAVGKIETAYLAQPDKFVLSEAFEAANQSVFESAKFDPVGKKRGTTAVAAFIKGDAAKVASVGDSRAYLIRDGELYQLTPEDSYAFFGYIQESKADLTYPMDPKTTEEFYVYSQRFNANPDNPLRNRITRAVGHSAERIDASIIEVSLKDKDILLLASDGLFVLDFQALKKIVAENKDNPMAAARALEEAARGSAEDNITVSVYRHEAIPEISPSQIVDIEEQPPVEEPSQERPTAIKEPEEWRVLINLLLRDTPLPEAKQAELVSALSEKIETAGLEDVRAAWETLRRVFPPLYLKAVKETDDHKTANKKLRADFEGIERDLKQVKEQFDALSLQAASAPAGQDLLQAGMKGIKVAVEQLILQYQDLNQKLAELNAQSADLEQAIIDHKELLSRLKNIIESQKLQYYSSQIRQAEEEHQRALQIPDIQMLQEYVQHLEIKDIASTKLALARATLKIALEPYAQKLQRKKEEIESKMREELALDEREKMIAERESEIVKMEDQLEALNLQATEIVKQLRSFGKRAEVPFEQLSQTVKYAQVLMNHLAKEWPGLVLPTDKKK